MIPIAESVQINMKIYFFYLENELGLNRYLIQNLREKQYKVVSYLTICKESKQRHFYFPGFFLC